MIYLKYLTAYLIALLLIVIGTSVLAEGSASLNLTIPQSPGTYGQDRFRAGDLDCSNSIDSATKMEFGVTGITNNDRAFADETTDVGVYARIIIPLGARPRSRVNCDTLYQLELQKKRLEILRLEKELQELKRLQFEN